MRCMKIQSDKRPHLNTKEDAENMALIATARINKKNGSSPENCRECPALDHSTPIRQKHSLNDMEDGSPDLDYCPSPILLPCTQEGINEVAWDWQSSLSKTPDTRRKKQNVQCETPKGTKILQRKRNSNSPLLYKPLKRKTIKMESIENIGQFAAELQALNERMRIIQRNNKNHLDDCVEENASPIINIENNKEILRIKDNEQNCNEKTNDYNIASRKSTNYDDLFDDSIDDSMARCTQEIEEKFNLIVVKGNSIVQSEANIKREDSLLGTNNTVDETCLAQCAFNVTSKETSVQKNLFYEDTKDNTLKTYSKLPLKKNINSSIHVPTWKDKDLHKPYVNNNNTIQHCEKLCDNKKSSNNHTTKLFDIPDDSFDDCLATCVEDENLLSTSMETDISLAHKNDNIKFESNCKYLTRAPLKGNLLNPTMKVELSTTNFFKNRKFFKTKSLSDQYLGQHVITNVKNSANTALSASCCTAKSTSHLNSLSKSSTISNTRVTRASVSTNPIVTNDCRKIENDTISLTRGADRTHESNVNRVIAVKEGGNRFVKYYSTGNMKHDTKETTKIGSQPTRCTAEEIERKRLEAKMRLEAKRKLYSLKVTNNINR